MTNEEKKPILRRRFLRWIVCLALIGGAAIWYFLPRPAPSPASASVDPDRVSYLDLLEPASLTEKSWPRADRPAEAVAVLDRIPEVEKRLQAFVSEGVVTIKNARGEEVLPPIKTFAASNTSLGMNKGDARDEHTAFVAAVSPKADRLAILGRSTHIPNFAAIADGLDGGGSSEWIQVWKRDGNTMTPLELEQMEGVGAAAAAFSPDGKLLATGNSIGIDIWEVGEKRLRNLGKIEGFTYRLQFTPDSRSLAVMKTNYFALHDLSPILERDEYTKWRFLSIAGGLLAGFVFTGGGRRSCIAAIAAFLGTVGSAIWDGWEPTPSGVPLTIGIGFGTALAVILLQIWAVILPQICVRRSAAEAEGRSRSLIVEGISRVAFLGSLVCFVLWAWQFWWSSPALVTPPHSELATTEIKSGCFSADGSELAVLRPNGRISLFDVAGGKKTQDWRMPDGVRRVDYADDGRHLLAIAENKAYVLRLKPFDNSAYVLSCSDKVLSQNPKSIDALLARGHVYLERGQLDKAIADFTAVIGQNAKNAAAHYARGLAHTDRGDYDQARKDFDAALDLDPKLAAVSGRSAP